MISLRSASMRSAGLAVCLAIGCRDAPTALPATDTPSRLSADFVLDSADQFPPDARILNPYTRVNYVDQGGHHLAEYSAGMEYQGNRASMKTNYDISGEGVSPLRDAIYNEHQSLISFTLWRRFDQVYYIEVPKFCGLDLEGSTQHQAWWHYFMPKSPFPEFVGKHAVAVSLAIPLTLEPCEEELQPTTTTSGSGGGYVTLTTCWYWVTFSGSRIVSIDLAWCDETVVPVDENMLNNMT